MGGAHSHCPIILGILSRLFTLLERMALAYPQYGFMTILFNFDTTLKSYLQLGINKCIAFQVCPENK